MSNPHTIDITPKWAGIMNWMCAVIEEETSSEEAKAPLIEEVIKMGRTVMPYLVHQLKYRKGDYAYRNKIKKTLMSLALLTDQMNEEIKDVADD